MKQNWIAPALFVLLAGPACTRELICVYPYAPAAKEATAAQSDEKKASVDDDAPEAKAPPAELAPLPDGRVRNAKEYFATLGTRFKPDATKDLHAVFQFDLTGPEALTYHADVDNGVMKLEKGTAEKPNVTLTASADDYVKIVNGELGGVGAVMESKMHVVGDAILARRMQDIFPPGHPAK